MTNQEYKELSPALLEQLKGREVWSMENMAEHGAEGRTVDYLGSTTSGHIVRDYYRDNAGAWWYKDRIRANGRIVSVETYLFGKEIKKRKRG